jgi:hypothetical protein
VNREIKELLDEIDEKELEFVSEPRRRLVRFLKEMYEEERKSSDEP